MIVMRMIVRMAVRMIVAVIVRVIVTVRVMMLNQRDRAHCAFSPFIRTFNSSESELRIAVVLSSRIFL